MTNAADLIKIAGAEIGYLEKASNKDLDSKTANAGKNNYTKYARDLHEKGYYTGSKQGLAWCDIFVDWCFLQLCGGDAQKAQEIICQTGPYGAGCTNSAQYYRNQGRFYTSNPKPGDQIFFWDADKTRVAHTGIVVDVDDTYVYTIEGNTSGASGVIANGGGVYNKRYEVNDSRIYGYGRPKYDAEASSATASTKKEGFEVTMKTLKKGSKGDQVKTLQAILIGHGFDLGRTGMDGDFGGKTDEALRKYQSKRGLTVDGIAGPKTWSKMLGQ